MKLRKELAPAQDRVVACSQNTMSLEIGMSFHSPNNANEDEEKVTNSFKSASIIVAEKQILPRDIITKNLLKMLLP